MARLRTSIIMTVIAMAVMCPCISYASFVSDEGDNVQVTDVRDSGCTNNTRASISRALVMTKEGDVVTCELQNYVENCGVDHFNVQPEYAQGTEAPDTMSLNVTSVVPSDMDCTCPYNISFTIRNVKADSLFLNCWLYTGMVSFKESNQITLKISSERVTIEGAEYLLYKPGQQAMLYKMRDGKGEVHIPSTISYDGKNYTVASLYMDGISIREMTKLMIPRTICRFGDNGEYKNWLNGRSPQLEAIEVEPDCPLLSSVNGVLFSADHKTLYCLPAGNKRTEYSVIDGVEKICRYAFAWCTNLKSIRIPESVTTIRPYAFSGCNNLEAIYIQGKQSYDGLAFEGMKSTPTLYVPDEEVEYYKTIYKGPVLPISSSEETSGISDFNRSANTLSESFDLQGRRMTGKPSKGVYVEDGKKRMVK